MIHIVKNDTRTTKTTLMPGPFPPPPQSILRPESSPLSGLSYLPPDTSLGVTVRLITANIMAQSPTYYIEPVIYLSQMEVLRSR